MGIYRCAGCGGSKVVSQLSEFIRSHHPNIKGYSRRNIYNMVMLYDEYSSPAFQQTVQKYLHHESVEPFVSRIEEKSKEYTVTAEDTPATIVQTVPAQFPIILAYTTLSNIIEITCRCHSTEERLFYILYAHKEKLAYRELQRCKNL